MMDLSRLASPNFTITLEYNEDLRTLHDKIEKLTSRKTEIETSQRNPSQQFVNMLYHYWLKEETCIHQIIYYPK